MYIWVKDSEGRENLWKVIKQDEDNYYIRRAVTVVKLPKDMTYYKNNFLYTDQVFDFENITITTRVMPYRCYRCGFRNGRWCNLKNLEVFDVSGHGCWFSRDGITMRVEPDFQTDMGYLEPDINDPWDCGYKEE